MYANLHSTYSVAISRRANSGVGRYTLSTNFMTQFDGGNHFNRTFVENRLGNRRKRHILAEGIRAGLKFFDPALDRFFVFFFSESGMVMGYSAVSIDSAPRFRVAISPFLYKIEQEILAHLAANHLLTILKVDVNMISRPRQSPN